MEERLDHLVMKKFKDQSVTISKTGSRVTINCEKGEDSEFIFQWIMDLCENNENQEPSYIVHNPFPEYGELLKIKILADYECNILDQLTHKMYPDVYTLELYYKNHTFTFTAFNLKEEDYYELINTYLKNAKIKFDKEGWPITMKWKNFKFKLASIYFNSYEYETENTHE